MGAAGAQVDQVFAALGPGVRGLVYDYSPHPFSSDPARFILPEVIEARGSAEQLVADWCGRALYRTDPVQGRAARMLQPFAWSYHDGEPSRIAADLERPEVGEVRERLLSWGLGRGMTVPLHLPGARLRHADGLCRGRGGGGGTGALCADGLRVAGSYRARPQGGGRCLRARRNVWAIPPKGYRPSRSPMCWGGPKAWW